MRQHGIAASPASYEYLDGELWYLGRPVESTMTANEIACLQAATAPTPAPTPAATVTLRDAVATVSRQFSGFSVELSDRTWADLDTPVPESFEVLVWKVGKDEWTEDRLIGEWAVYWNDGNPELARMD
jgi:hypothetical protein